MTHQRLLSNTYLRPANRDANCKNKVPIEEIEIEIAEAPLEPEEQTRKLNRFFEIVLDADLKTFRPAKEENLN